MTSCEAPQGQNETAGLGEGAPKGGVRPLGKLNPFLASKMRETVLRKRVSCLCCLDKHWVLVVPF